MATLHFTKMHGLGNDYIYIDALKYGFPARINEVARLVSDRHTGIGADGLVLILPSDKADIEMRMFNADGSEGAMCGNAIRCVGKYVAEAGYTVRNDIYIDTLSGVKHLTLHRNSQKPYLVHSVTVDMGVASFAPDDIPLLSDTEYINHEIEYTAPNGEIAKLHATVLSVGNPHCVIPMKRINAFPLKDWGNEFEFHPLFPNRINTEIVEQLALKHLRMRVWERGSGETMACGTGACAAVAAFCRLGLTPFNTDITVFLRGGDLTISCSEDYSLTMTGPATEVFRGTMKLTLPK